ncbi:MAG: uracil-DNA glycosylase [Candidatus Omnitrophica bacterium]|nr:uracil-DNA glycosylase [Candidatus Omnitrophota bacterium]
MPTSQNLFLKKPYKLFNPQLDELYQQINNCHKCNISNDLVNITDLDKGYGKLPIHEGRLPVLIVGINPSIHRTKICMEKGAFYGKTTGDLLTQLLKKAGFNKDDFWITNLVKCSTPNNRNLSEEEIKNCCKYLFRELEIIDPKLIICLGTEVKNFFGGRFYTFTDWILRKVFSLPHPAQLKYNPSFKSEYINQLKRIKEYING